MDKIIEIEGLKKSFGTIEAVKGIDFYVKKNQLFAFLGKNGAGKSTTIDMICTLLRPDAGRIRIGCGYVTEDDEAIRTQIGVVFQNGCLDGLLTVEENLYVRGSFYGLSGKALKNAVERAAESAGAKDFLKRRYGKLSGGMKRRADIARALVNIPQILFLDEPTTGLDPQTRKDVWQTVRKLQKQTGMTVFLTTHYMEEAAKADYVAVIEEGKLIEKGTPSALREQYSRDRLRLKVTEPGAVKETLARQNFSYREEGGVITVYLNRTTDALPLLREFDTGIEMLEVLAGSMDDAFIEITGKETEK